MAKFEQRSLIMERPEHVPADHVIFMAPRPILGVEIPTGSTYGPFYTHIGPDYYGRERAIEYNRQMHACVLAYTTEEIVKEKVRAYYKEHDYTVTEEELEDNWKSCFFQHFCVSEVEII